MEELLNRLDYYVGKWELTGPGLSGVQEYQWDMGRNFMLKKVHIVQNGEINNGLEIIGIEKNFAEAPKEILTSWYFDNQGNTFRYYYILSDEEELIWAGEVNSGAYYKGTLNVDKTESKGQWIFPGGEGFESTAIKVS